MKKRMFAFLLLGAICVLTGLILAGAGFSHGIVPALMVAIGAGWIGCWAIWFISSKGGNLVRDEMVVRVQTLSGNYSFIATMWFVLVLGTINGLYTLPWKTSELLLAMVLFMSISNLLFRWILLKLGKAE